MPTSVVHHLRRIVKLTEDGKGTIAFVTNDMTHSSEEICEIYRRRWATGLTHYFLVHIFRYILLT
jgi:hypothetical protein